MAWPTDYLTAIAWQLVALAAIATVALVITSGPVHRRCRRGRHFPR